VIKPRRIRWAGHVARLEERRVEVHTEFWWGNLRNKDHLGLRREWEDNINLAVQDLECGS
jgi:hypothetical protein